MTRPIPTAEDLADTVVRARLDAGMSERELAAQARMELHKLQNRLHGTTPFVYEEIARVAVALGMSASELIRKTEELAGAKGAA